MGWGAMPEGPLFPTIAGQTPFWKAPQSTLRLEDGSSVTLQVGGKVRPGQRPALPAPPPWRTGSPPHSSREPGSPENGQVGLQGSTGGGLFFTPSLRCWVCLRRGTAWGRTETASRFASCLRTALWLDPPPQGVYADNHSHGLQFLAAVLARNVCSALLREAWRLYPDRASRRILRAAYGNVYFTKTSNRDARPEAIGHLTATQCPQVGL